MPRRRRLFFALLLLPACILAVGCADLGPCSGEVIEVSTGYSPTDEAGVVDDSACVVYDDGDGVYDATECCPVDYTFLGITPDGQGVVCEKTCDGEPAEAS